MSEKTALERLYEDTNSLHNDGSQYSVEDLLDMEDEGTILNRMSNESKETLFSKIEKVELDDEQAFEEPELNEEPFEEIEVEQIPEVEEVQEVKRGRGRPRKEETVQVKDDDEDRKLPVSISSLDKFMDSLAKDLIQELRDKKYETRNFNREQMLVILDYLEKKI